MKQRIQQCGAVILFTVLLCTLILNTGFVYAINASAVLATADAQDPENGILYVSFSVQADTPMTLSGDITVNGGVFLGITAPGCLVRNKRFVYNAGTQDAVSGMIRIGITEIQEITVTVSGSASSVYDFSTFYYSGSLTVPQDQLAGFLPGEHTEPAPEGPGSSSYLTLPGNNEPDPGQSERDASIAEKIREEQAAKAASEAAENQEEADRMRAADESRLAVEEAERQARGQQAGILPREEREVQSKTSESEEEDISEESAETSLDISNDIEADQTDVRSSGSPEKTEEQKTHDVTAGVPDISPSVSEKTDPQVQTGQETALSPADVLLIAGGVLAVFLFLFASAKAVSIIIKKH